jgi:hypothetical protein
VVFPSAGTWAWEIAAPPFTIQGNRQGDAAVFEPLVVAPAVGAPAQSSAPTVAAQPAETPALLGVSPAALRWAGVVLLVIAAGFALAAQRGGAIRRRVARSQ